MLCHWDNYSSGLIKMGSISDRPFPKTSLQSIRRKLTLYNLPPKNKLPADTVNLNYSQTRGLCPDKSMHSYLLYIVTNRAKKTPTNISIFFNNLKSKHNYLKFLFTQACE